MVPDFDLFTLTEAVGVHPAGSTVSGATLSRHGFHVDAVVRQHPQGGYTHAVAMVGTKRQYSGWWPSRAAARTALRISPAVDHAAEDKQVKLDRLGSQGAAPARLAAIEA